eukprot:GCRY01002761.1.p1 GENE.GCRY01002761.1~~GCRY01002761.1.p1  ORF type:complete len:143 (+),score=33.80 GCRY01002761.1:160-588(+)
MNPQQCEVCLNTFQKYTCPQCQIKYCSVDCFKKHKGNCVKKTVSAPSPVIDVHKEPVLFDEENVFLTEAQKQKLDSSTPLHKQLNDPQLQKVVRYIDSVNQFNLKKAEKILSARLNADSDFAAFVQLMLSEIKPEEMDASYP